MADAKILTLFVCFAFVESPTLLDLEHKIQSVSRGGPGSCTGYSEPVSRYFNIHGQSPLGLRPWPTHSHLLQPHDAQERLPVLSL